MHRNEQDRNSLVFAGTTVPFSLDVSDLNLLPFSTFLREPNTRKTRGELSWLYTEWSTIFLHMGSSMSWTVKGTWKQVLYNNISKVWCLRLPAQQRSQTVPQRWRMMMAMSEFLSDEVLKYQIQIRWHQGHAGASVPALDYWRSLWSGCTIWCIRWHTCLCTDGGHF